MINPSFVLIDGFLGRTMALLDNRHLSAAVMLVRPDFAGVDKVSAYQHSALPAGSRSFNRAVAEFTCCRRIRWLPGTTESPRWWCSWFVWRAGHTGPPVNTRLRKADLALGLTRLRRPE